MFITKQKLINDFAHACQELPLGPILIHSDLFASGITAPPNDRLQIGKDYEEAIQKVLGDRTTIFPTFNYDFCRNGIYDRINSPSQVGALSDYFRQHYAQERTYTPIFNFVFSNGVGEFTLNPSTNVFGEDSLFSALHKQKGIVLFLGADFYANTFIHYVEEMHRIGYRYHKTFTGNVLDGNTTLPVQVKYRVRPWPHMLEYDWHKLETEGKQQGVIKEFPIGNGKLLYYRTHELYDLWSAQLKSDPFYLLAPSAHQLIQQLRTEKGYPFQIEMFEQKKP